MVNLRNFYRTKYFLYVIHQCVNILIIMQHIGSDRFFHQKYKLYIMRTLRNVHQQIRKTDTSRGNNINIYYNFFTSFYRTVALYARSKTTVYKFNQKIKRITQSPQTRRMPIQFYIVSCFMEIRIRQQTFSTFLNYIN